MRLYYILSLADQHAYSISAKKVFYMKCILYLFTAKGSVVSLKYNHPEEKKCLSLGFQLTIFYIKIILKVLKQVCCRKK